MPYGGGKKHDRKRGRGASGKTPFLAAVSTNIKGHIIYMRLSRIKSFSTSEIEHWSFNHLQRNSVVVSDGLRCFNGVSNAGFLHESVVTGGGYESVEIPILKWVNTMLGNIKRSLHGIHTMQSARSMYHVISLNFVIDSIDDFAWSP